MLGAALGFAILLGVAAWSKLRDLEAFRLVLEDYRLVPSPLLRSVAGAVPVSEGILALAWLAAAWNSTAAMLAALGTAVAMAGYGAAIAANLLRGRSWIDCGCGGGEQLSWALVARNGVLAGLALGALQIHAPTAPGWGDVAVSVPVLTLAVLLYLAASALLDNHAAMRIWREG